MSDICFEDNFITEISKDLELDSEFESPEINVDKGSLDEENLEQHIQNSVYPTKESFPPALTEEEKAEVDSRSIYVGNVDYSSTAKELEVHFKGCGAINKITILTDKFTGHPKGFAYIEFASIDSVDTAMLFDESEFRGRQLKVMPKRTNIPGLSTTNRPPRSYRRGGYRGAFVFRQMSSGAVQNGGGAYPKTSHYRRRHNGGQSFAPY